MLHNNYSAWPHSAAEAAGRRLDPLDAVAAAAVMRGEDPAAAMAQHIADNKRAEILEAAIDGERSINRFRMRQAAQQFRDVLDTLGVDVRDLVSALDEGDESGKDGGGSEGGAPAAAPM